VLVDLPQTRSISGRHVRLWRSPRRGVWYCTSNTIDLDTVPLDGVFSPGASAVTSWVLVHTCPVSSSGTQPSNCTTYAKVAPASELPQLVTLGRGSESRMVDVSPVAGTQHCDRASSDNRRVDCTTVQLPYSWF
jgi:hypothetical protein